MSSPVSPLSVSVVISVPPLPPPNTMSLPALPVITSLARIAAVSSSRCMPSLPTRPVTALNRRYGSRTTPSVMSPGPPPPRRVTSTSPASRYWTRPRSPNRKSLPVPLLIVSLPSPPNTMIGRLVGVGRPAEPSASTVSSPAWVLSTKKPSLESSDTYTVSLPAPVLSVVTVLIGVPALNGAGLMAPTRLWVPSIVMTSAPLPVQIVTPPAKLPPVLEPATCASARNPISDGASPVMLISLTISPADGVVGASVISTLVSAVVSASSLIQSRLRPPPASMSSLPRMSSRWPGSRSKRPCVLASRLPWMVWSRSASDET